MIVADTNLVAYLLIDGERTNAARKVWKKDPEWVLPPLWRSEFLNVLSLATRSGIIPETQAIQTWRTAIHLFRDSEQEPGGEEVLREAVRVGITAYDAQFSVLARRLAVTLVTGDRKLARACRDCAVSIETFARRK